MKPMNRTALIPEIPATRGSTAAAPRISAPLRPLPLRTCSLGALAAPRPRRKNTGSSNLLP
jgi:hypothetical protein